MRRSILLNQKYSQDAGIYYCAHETEKSKCKRKRREERKGDKRSPPDGATTTDADRRARNESGPATESADWLTCARQGRREQEEEREVGALRGECSDRSFSRTRDYSHARRRVRTDSSLSLSLSFRSLSSSGTGNFEGAIDDFRIYVPTRVGDAVSTAKTESTRKKKR